MTWQRHMAPTTRSACLALLALLTLCLITIEASEQLQVVCPFEYKRHSLDDIRTRAKRPYLFGGIYESERECINCKRGALWSTFCGFQNTGKVPFWDNQLCNASQLEAVIDRTLKQNDAELLQMTPCDLWHYLRGRTLWIIGDSMSKDLYKALKCFMVEFHDLKTYHASNNFTAMHLLDAIPGYGEPHCVHMPENTRLCQIHAIQGDLFIEGNRTAMGVLPLLHESLALPHDIFILNFGLWHGETRQAEYQENLHQLGKYYASVKAKFPNMFFMETPKQHFDSEDGDYKVPWIGVRKGPWVCQPVKGVSMDADNALSADPSDAVGQYVVGGGWRNVFAHQILEKQYGMPMMNVYNVTATAWEFHRVNFDGQECSHYCHPSIPQLWLWTMKQTFKKWWISPVHDWMYKKPRPGCASVLDRDEAKLGNPRPLEDMLQQQHRERGIWAWLLGRKKPQVRNGVAVYRTSDPDTGFSHSSTINSWSNLQKLLAHSQQRPKGQQHRKGQQQQQQQQTLPQQQPAQQQPAQQQPAQPVVQQAAEQQQQQQQQLLQLKQEQGQQAQQQQQQQQQGSAHRHHRKRKQQQQPATADLQTDN